MHSLVLDFWDMSLQLKWVWLSFHGLCMVVFLYIFFSAVQKMYVKAAQPKWPYHCYNIIADQDPPKSTLLSHQWCSNAPYSFSIPSSKRFLMHCFSDNVFAKQHGAYGSLHRGGFQRRLSGGLPFRLCVKISQKLSHRFPS